MKTEVGLLDSLRSAGVEVSLDGDRLRVRAPRGALSGELRAEVARRAPELRALLRHEVDALDPLSWPPTEAEIQASRAAPELSALEVESEERAAIFEYCGGLSRGEAEQAARVEVEEAVARGEIVVLPVGAGRAMASLDAVPVGSSEVAEFERKEMRLAPRVWGAD
ncbi:MAG: hypothetical protein AB1486_25525 [Planctomycetota bacterium]